MKLFLPPAVFALAMLAAATVQAAPFTPDNPVNPNASLLIQTQGFQCRACRRDCHARYRVYCGYSERCRRAFTLCMRECWYGYCR
jgi:hypothetical protein